MSIPSPWALSLAASRSVFPSGGVAKALSEIWRADGVRGLYRGYKWAVLRAFPANGAAMLGIELVNGLFR